MFTNKVSKECSRVLKNRKCPAPWTQYVLYMKKCVFLLKNKVADEGYYLFGYSFSNYVPNDLDLVLDRFRFTISQRCQ